MHLQDGLELSLERVSHACVQVSGEICTVSLENILYLQSNQNNVTECPASSRGSVNRSPSIVWVLEFLKANESPGLKTCFSGLLTGAQCVGSPLHDVFSTGSVCTCTESTCFAVVAVIAGVEGVVVLKGVSISGAVGTVLELYWHCKALHLFQMLFRIWNMFDVPSDVPLPVPFPVLT